MPTYFFGEVDTFFQAEITQYNAKTPHAKSKIRLDIGKLSHHSKVFSKLSICIFMLIDHSLYSPFQRL